MKQFKTKSEGTFQTPERHNLNKIPNQRINRNLSPLQKKGNSSQNSVQRLALEFRRAIIHKDPIKLFRVVKAIRIKLSEDANPTLEDFLETGLISDIMKLLDPDDKINIDLQYEIIWIIINVYTENEDRTSEIITRSLIETILRFIWHPEQRIVEKALWVARNIPGRNDAEINSLIQLDVFLSISKLTRKTKKYFPQEILRLNDISHEQILRCDLLRLTQNMLWLADDEICSKTCWTYSNLTNQRQDKYRAVLLTPRFLDRIVQLLEIKNLDILRPAIRTVGNILSSGSCYKTQMYSAGCLDKLEALIEYRKPIIRREAIQAITNLVTEPILLAEILQRPLFSKLLHTIHIDLTSVQREAIVCLKNALRIANRQQVKSLVKLGLIRSLPKILSSGNLEVIMTGLEAIEIILRHGLEAEEPYNPYLSVLYSEGVVLYLEGLQSHPDHDVYIAVVRIIETYFEVEQDI